MREINLCSCLTKTQDIKYHKSWCLYRIEIEGYESFGENNQPKDCPFKLGTKEHDAWMTGYIMADAKEAGES